MSEALLESGEWEVNESMGLIFDAILSLIQRPFWSLFPFLLFFLFQRPNLDHFYFPQLVWVGEGISYLTILISPF